MSVKMAIEQDKSKSAVAAQQTALSPAEQKQEEDKKLRWSEKTTGEKAYEIIQFLAGKVFIIAVTAVIAFRAHPKWGKDKLLGGRIPNYLKQAQKWADHKVLHNKIFAFGERGPAAERFGHIFAATLLISHGGTAFAPFIRWLENGKEGISQFFNKLIGKPGEFEKAHERLKDEPKQSWWDTIKGRMYALVAGFTAATAADAAINKFVGKHKSGKYYLDAYEEWFGRWLAGWTKKGKELGFGQKNLPITKELSKAQEANKIYRFGRLVALDLYITTATLILWTAISRSSARKRKAEKKHQEEQAATAVPSSPAIAADDDTEHQQEKKSFAERVGKSERSAENHAAKTPHKDFATAVQQQNPGAPELSVAG